jgi:phage tail protein X
MTYYETRNGDVLDLICFNHYGHEIGTTEVVLENNRGLADYGATLPAGLTIELPDLSAPAVVTEQVNLWD